MQFELSVKCGCGKSIGKVRADTAFLPEELQAKVNKLILAHRGECKYYQPRAV